MTRVPTTTFQRQVGLVLLAFSALAASALGGGMDALRTETGGVERALYGHTGSASLHGQSAITLEPKASTLECDEEEPSPDAGVCTALPFRQGSNLSAADHGVGTLACSLPPFALSGHPRGPPVRPVLRTRA
jgi:hypothetical protein